MHPVVLLLLLGLATYRLTRLVVRDEFPPARGIRTTVERWAYEPDRFRRWEWLGDLVTCHWCASAYVAAALIAGVEWFSSQPVPLPFVFWLATWALGALLAHSEPEK
jgi:hypothetical protein